jgi:tRNA1(Val) A37 N6-methylase TrmN6
MRSRPIEAPRFSFAVTDDAVLDGRLKLWQPARGHRAGHDAILLAAAAPKSTIAIDLGAGIGTAGLALLARNAARHVTFVEIDVDLARLSGANAERNDFAEKTMPRSNPTLRDLSRRGGPPKPAAASADLVVVNPPFNDPAQRRASPDAVRRRAHAAPDGEIDSWVEAASRLLKSNGRVVLIHRPESDRRHSRRSRPSFRRRGDHSDSCSRRCAGHPDHRPGAKGETHAAPAAPRLRADRPRQPAYPRSGSRAAGRRRA